MIAVFNKNTILKSKVKQRSGAYCVLVTDCNSVSANWIFFSCSEIGFSILPVDSENFALIASIHILYGITRYDESGIILGNNTCY